MLELANDGAITFAPSATGEALDQAGARTADHRALMEGRSSVELPTRTLPPAIATEQVAAAHEQLVRMLADTAPVQ